MKTYFIRLLSYDRHTNLLLLNIILEAGAPEKPVQLMAHLLAAQQVWLSRCKKEASHIALFPDWKAATFEMLIEQNHQQWIEFVNEVADLDETLSYQSFSGDRFNNTISEILTHVINHGTHHRAQIGQHLKLAGVEQLPITDYIFYLRQ